MKWLLAVGGDKNPGDRVTDLGIEALIREVDPNPYIERVARETSAIYQPVDCDCIVWCGGPVLWSWREHRCYRHGWWEAITGWMANRRLLIAGAGLTGPWGGLVTDLKMLNEASDRLADACGGNVYARDTYAAGLLGCEALPDPSIFAWRLQGVEPLYPGGAKICNLMSHGAHEAVFGPDEAAVWNGRIYDVATKLRDEGFFFIAHSQDEFELACKAGFDELHRWAPTYTTPDRLLRLYAGCKQYVGNRIHGAIFAASQGASTLCVTYDARGASVERVGGDVVFPSGVDIDSFSIPSNLCTGMTPQQIGEAWKQQVEIFRGFAEGEE